MFEEKIKKELYRELRIAKTRGAFLEHDSKTYLNLSSNDYLGISAHTDWQDEFFSEMSGSNNFLVGSCSSRLLTGNDPSYDLLEKEIAKSYNKESCLVFGSGYHANLGILSALAQKDDLILADKLVHASLIDGMKLCQCKWWRYRHNDFDHLEQILRESRKNFRNVYIVTESIFSMEGDCVDLARLVTIKKKYDTFLYLDEAHAVGVRGEQGLGLAEEIRLLGDVDLLVGTFGKAIASHGAFLVSNNLFREMLINMARTLIFTTALPPIINRWTHFVWQKMLNMQKERDHLRTLAELFRRLLSDRELLGNSHIVPMLVGNNEQCLEIADQLRNSGLWVSAIRHPTVPLNQPRIRFSLTAALTEQQIRNIYDTILETL